MSIKCHQIAQDSTAWDEVIPGFLVKQPIIIGYLKML